MHQHSKGQGVGVTYLRLVATCAVALFALYLYRVTISWAAGACGLVVIVFVAKRMRRQDPYGSFHFQLNKLPGDTLDSPPKTEWLNMGYWKVRSFIAVW
jgi:hypothetical protein